jgi:hypothetical protein
VRRQPSDKESQRKVFHIRSTMRPLARGKQEARGNATVAGSR